MLIISEIQYVLSIFIKDQAGETNLAEEKVINFHPHNVIKCISVIWIVVKNFEKVLTASYSYLQTSY